MLSLYGAGDRAAALRAYQRFRKVVAEETGLEPCQPIQDLHQRILASGSVFDLRLPANRSISSNGSSDPIPRQLPRDPADFVGRGEELVQLRCHEALPGRTAGLPTMSSPSPDPRVRVSRPWPYGPRTWSATAFRAGSSTPTCTNVPGHPAARTPGGARQVPASPGSRPAHRSRRRRRGRSPVAQPARRQGRPRRARRRRRSGPGPSSAVGAEGQHDPADQPADLRPGRQLRSCANQQDEPDGGGHHARAAGGRRAGRQGRPGDDAPGRPLRKPAAGRGHRGGQAGEPAPAMPTASGRFPQRPTRRVVARTCLATRSAPARRVCDHLVSLILLIRT